MTSVARPTLRRLPLAAVAVGFVGLAVALVSGPGAPPIPSTALAAAAGVLLLAELAIRGRALLRTGLGHQLAFAALVAAVTVAGWSVVSAADLEVFALAFVLGIGGTALVVLALLRIADEAIPGRTPWQALIGSATGAGGARLRLRSLGPLLAGVLAGLVALRLMVEALSEAVGSPPDGALALTLVMVAVFVIGPGWALRGVVGRLAARHEAPVARHEQVVAAHLHDSVLQTLSLIQRTDDPVRMAQLARQQEHSLRSWLAGREDTEDTTLGAAVRFVARSVEAELPGGVIDVVVVGDAPLTDAGAELVQAGREAMRNAARHAGTPVEVYLEIHERGAHELFVRDTGAGFDLGAVAEARRGVRDAIIGRMEHAGGTAAIDSTLAGTEIALRLPASPEAQA